MRQLIKTYCKLFVLSTLTASMIVTPLLVNAGVLITVKSPGKDNDCGTFFKTGNGFDSCAVNGSPVIIKYDDYDDDAPIHGSTEINSQFAGSITGDEFQITFADGSNDDGVGTWSYTQGANDPNVRYWVAKGGKNGFNLHFQVDNEAATGACAAAAAGGTTVDMLSEACLNEAIPVISGNFVTPDNKPGNPASLSHLTFYDTGTGSGTPVGTNGVPIPSSVLLFLGAGGLLCATAYRRREQDLPEDSADSESGAIPEGPSA